jgi:hypothetical protein
MSRPFVRLIHPDLSIEAWGFFTRTRMALKSAVRRLTLIMLALGAVAAAQGGKAEPLRIRFQPGRTSTTLTGVLGGDAQREYAFAARKDQRLRIRLTFTPPGSLTITAKQPRGIDLPLSVDSSGVWSAQLSDDGEYEIWVTRASGTRTRSRYTMTVTIR